LAPLIALLSHRRIAADEVESSVMRFQALDNFEDVITKIEADNVEAMIVSPEGMLRSFPPFTTYLLQQYRLDSVFESPDGITVEFWRHI